MKTITYGLSYAYGTFLICLGYILFVAAAGLTRLHAKLSGRPS